MKLIKTLILASILLLLIAVAAGFFMDPQWQVERRGNVPAPVATVYNYMSTLPNWAQWTAWNTEAYPDMQLAYTGPAAGVGARQSWSDGAMSGYVEVTAVEPGKNLDYLVSMEDGKSTMDCRLSVEPAATGSTVLWLCSGNSGSNPLDKIMMAAYRPMIGRDFEIGLARLRQHFDSAN